MKKILCLLFVCFELMAFSNPMFAMTSRAASVINSNPKAYVFLADGFEDVEVTIPIDVLRRGGVNVVTVSIMNSTLVESAHSVNIKADMLFKQGTYDDADLLIIPGGMPGARNLSNHEGVCKAIKNQLVAGKKVAAICAAPSVVLAAIGVLNGKNATCYPNYESALKPAGANYTGNLVTVDGNITTAEGPAAAFPFAFELLSQLVSKSTSKAIAEGMRYKHLMEGDQE